MAFFFGREGTGSEPRHSCRTTRMTLVDHNQSRENVECTLNLDIRDGRVEACFNAEHLLSEEELDLVLSTHMAAHKHPEL